MNAAPATLAEFVARHGALTRRVAAYALAFHPDVPIPAFRDELAALRSTPDAVFAGELAGRLARLEAKRRSRQLERQIAFLERRRARAAA